MPILFNTPKYKVHRAADGRTGRWGFEPFSWNGNGLPGEYD